MVRKLFGRLALLTIPLFLGVLAYVVLDPFKVLRSYRRYYDGSPAMLNRDYVSTQYFLDTYGERHYDSFIFGSSRSQAFHCADWQRYIAPDARPYHFDAWRESLFGIRTKLALLAARKVPVREALVVVDLQTLSVGVNMHSHLFVKHPAASGESPLVFQGLFVGAFFTRGFFVKYLDWKVFGVRREYMKDVFEDQMLSQLPDTNDLIFQTSEDELKSQGEDEYYTKRAGIFPQQHPGTLNAVLDAEHESMLADVARMLRSQGTRLRVIVSPLYDEMRIADSDRETLERLFGEENVCDFSGVNAWTENRRNYYEESHYRPKVARDLMDLAYAGTAHGGRCSPLQDADPTADNPERHR